MILFRARSRVSRGCLVAAVSATTAFAGLPVQAAPVAGPHGDGASSGGAEWSAASVGADSAVRAPLPDPKVRGEQCTTKRGVTVVVDFRDLHNETGRRMNLVKIGCARNPANGLAAITKAGFELQHRTGFVCRIDERPLAEQTDCASEGYWSYWHASRDGEWDFSGVGPGGWVPPAGSLEGWAWNWYDQEAADPRVDSADLFPPAPRE